MQEKNSLEPQKKFRNEEKKMIFKLKNQDLGARGRAFRFRFTEPAQPFTSVSQVIDNDNQ